MSRLIAPDKGCVETDVKNRGGTSRYRRSRDGTYHVDSPGHVRALRDSGFVVAGTRIRTGDERDAPGPWCAHGLRPFFCSDCSDEGN